MKSVQENNKELTLPARHTLKPHEVHHRRIMSMIID